MATSSDTDAAVAAEMVAAHAAQEAVRTKYHDLHQAARMEAARARKAYDRGLPLVLFLMCSISILYIILSFTLAVECRGPFWILCQKNYSPTLSSDITIVYILYLCATFVFHYLLWYCLDAIFVSRQRYATERLNYIVDEAIVKGSIATKYGVSMLGLDDLRTYDEHQKDVKEYCDTARLTERAPNIRIPIVLSVAIGSITYAAMSLIYEVFVEHRSLF